MVLNWNRLCYHIFCQSVNEASMRKLNWCLFLASLSQLLWESKQPAQLSSQSFPLLNVWCYYSILPSCKRIKPPVAKGVWAKSLHCSPLLGPLSSCAHCVTQCFKELLERPARAISLLINWRREEYFQWRWHLRRRLFDPFTFFVTRFFYSILSKWIISLFPFLPGW